MAAGGKQTGVELPVRRDPGACAAPAERLGDRGNDAYFAATVHVPETGGNFARVVRRQGDQRYLAVDQSNDFAGRNHVVHQPAVGGAHVHELDEAQDVIRPAEVLCHGHDLVLVHTPLHHHVDLDRTKPGFDGGGDAFEHSLQRKVHVVHRAEDAVIQGVHAHGEPLQAGVSQSPGLGGECGAVGGQGQVFEAFDARQHLHQLGQIAPQQGLAAGQADLLHAQVHEDTRQAHQFFKAEDLALGQEGVVAAKHFLWHAVGAAKVAAVRDRQPQVMQCPAKRILGSADRGCRGRIGHQRANERELRVAGK